MNIDQVNIFELDWVDHTSLIAEETVFFLINPLLGNLEEKKQKLKQYLNYILKIPATLNFFLIPVSCVDLGYLYSTLDKHSNIIILPAVDLEGYRELVLKKYYKKPKTIIGITGTSGKTSTVNILADLFRQNSISVSCLGSVSSELDSVFRKKLPVGFPISFLEYHKFLNDSALNSVEVAILECTSIGIAQQRIIGIEFDLIIYTSFSEDHIEAHANLFSYFVAKLKLINYLKKNGKVLFNNSSEEINFVMKKFFDNIDKYSVNRISTSLANSFNRSSEGDFIAELEKQKLTIVYKNQSQDKFVHNLCGDFYKFIQLDNLIMAVAAFYLIRGVFPKVLKELREIPGRFNKMESGSRVCLVDFCHNIEKYQYFIRIVNLAMEQGVLEKRKIVIIAGIPRLERTVRFKALRFVIDHIDKFILTSDCYDFEGEVNFYLDQIKKLGGSKVEYIKVRQEAIKHALKTYGNEKNILCFLSMGANTKLKTAGIDEDYCEMNFVKENIHLGL